MAPTTITIRLNEESRVIPKGTLVGDLRDRVKPGADVLVVNGFPAKPHTGLDEGDEVVLIRRGEIPDEDQLETLMVARHTPKVHARMKSATVGVAGLGGLGSNVAIALARMGIGTLILADFDVVEPTNLNRQQYSIHDIGMLKTEAMARILAGINPYLNVITHEVVLERSNVGDVFKNADVLVECFDRPEPKAEIIQAAAELLPETYVIGASGLAGYGDSNSIQSMKLGEKIYMVGDLTKAAQPGRGLMAPRVSIAAGHQANLVVALLMDADHLTL